MLECSILFLQGHMTAANDVFALGRLLWEMCAQQRAFAGLSLQSIQSMISRRQPMPSLPTHLPAGIQVWCPASALLLALH